MALAINLLLLVGLGLVAIYLYVAPQLPSVELLRDVQLQEPLRVYTADGKLIAEFGAQRRQPVAFKDLPTLLVRAFLAAEDDRFFEHPGVDYQGLLRAAMALVRTGEKRQGGSTITMQVARNFFLSPEKTYRRKLAETLLALRIESRFSKQEIFELYANKIFFGHRAYGIAAAAQTYYGKSVEALTLPEMAMLAGLPKGPSIFNPIANPKRALERRNYVLRRMHSLRFIDDSAYQQALAAVDDAELHGNATEADAPYVAEMVRRQMFNRYGDAAYTGGFQVYTTVTPGLQQAATRALRRTLLAYDERHGYRGAERRVQGVPGMGEAGWDAVVREVPVVGGLLPGLVLKISEQEAWVYLGQGRVAKLGLPAMEWARKFITVDRRGSKPKSVKSVLAPGDLVRLRVDDDGSWRLAEVPRIEGALVALEPVTGAVQALSGGFDYSASKFNRAADALRQPGSSFKPFIYSAALEKGWTPATLVRDEPVSFVDGSGHLWQPKNYERRYEGPIRLREALTFSRNLASINLLHALGVDYAIQYARRFGFGKAALPHGLSLALGTGVVTPLEMARGYAAFANGGFRIEPYVIARILDGTGHTVFTAEPAVACPQCGSQASDGAVQEVTQTESGGLPVNRAPRVLNPRNVYQLTSMLRDVIRRGTGRRALKLGRSDIAGKTGTTNDQRDAWFCGFQRHLVTTAWVGMDQPSPLGRRETGAHAALPMWIDFMGVALDGKPEETLPAPPGMVTVRINAETGNLTDAGDPDSVMETVRDEYEVMLLGPDSHGPQRAYAPAPGWESAPGDRYGSNVPAGQAYGAVPGRPQRAPQRSAVTDLF